MKFFLSLFRFVLVNHKPELDTEYLSKETKEQLEQGQKREVIFFCRESKTAQAWKLLSILKSNSLIFITLSVLHWFLISGKSEGSDDRKGKKKMKVKGRNKQRPVTHIKSKDKLCPTIFQERECSFGERCKFSHDIKEFMQNKPPDIGPECFMFETYGKCPYGLACRYGSKHISEDHKNIVNKELYEEKSKVSIINPEAMFDWIDN